MSDIQPTQEVSEIVVNFKDQYLRLFTTWKNLAGVRTQSELFKRLNITNAEYLEACNKNQMPEAWLIQTANALRLDVEYIRTGKVK